MLNEETSENVQLNKEMHAYKMLHVCIIITSWHDSSIEVRFIALLLPLPPLKFACNCIEINRYMHRKFKLDDHKNMYECSIEGIRGERERERESDRVA